MRTITIRNAIDILNGSGGWAYDDARSVKGLPGQLKEVVEENGIIRFTTEGPFEIPAIDVFSVEIDERNPLRERMFFYGASLQRVQSKKTDGGGFRSIETKTLKLAFVKKDIASTSKARISEEARRLDSNFLERVRDRVGSGVLQTLCLGPEGELKFWFDNNETVTIELAQDGGEPWLVVTNSGERIRLDSGLLMQDKK